MGHADALTASLVGSSGARGRTCIRKCKVTSKKFSVLPRASLGQQSSVSGLLRHIFVYFLGPNPKGRPETSACSQHNQGVGRGQSQSHVNIASCTDSAAFP
uniref:Uncharacterized protein n=1 Tax=Pyrodinium bahamense TaxID=73915 RepID=A0A7S0B125_9DINO